MPAFLTADEMAFTAVKMAFISWVRSPVAVGCFLCSASRNLVRVMQSVSMPPVLDILAVVKPAKLQTSQNTKEQVVYSLCVCKVALREEAES